MHVGGKIHLFLLLEDNCDRVYFLREKTEMKDVVVVFMKDMKTKRC